MSEITIETDARGYSSLIVRAPQHCKPFVAEIVGRDPTYRYSRSFCGRRLTEATATEVVSRIAVEYSKHNPHTPQLLDIRSDRRDYYCCYRDILGALRLQQIDENTLRELMEAKEAASVPYRERALRAQEERLTRLNNEIAGAERLIDIFGENPAYSSAYVQDRARLIEQSFIETDKLHDLQELDAEARERARNGLIAWRDTMLADNARLEERIRSRQREEEAADRAALRRRDEMRAQRAAQVSISAFAEETLVPRRNRRKKQEAKQPKLPPVLVTGRKRVISFD